MFIHGMRVGAAITVTVGAVSFRVILDCASTGRAVLVIDAPAEVVVHKEETLKKESER